MKPPPSKWDAILELEAKPKPIEQHLIEEAAKLLAAELKTFPPPLGGFELEGDAARFGALFEEPTRPGEGVYRVAFHLARLDLQHEFQEIDLYMRNQRYLPLAPSERDKLCLLLLSRWLTEQALSLKDQLHTPLSRARLCELLDLAERRLLGPSGQA